MLLRLILLAIIINLMHSGACSASSTNPLVAQILQTTPKQDPLSKININTASVPELLAIKELNIAQAKAIVYYRNNHGKFTDLNKLGNIRGLQKLSPEQLASVINRLTIA